MEELALFGGPKSLDEDLAVFDSIGPDEIVAVNEVMKSGCISGFFGSPGPGFWGGPKIQEFEQAFCDFTGSKFAVSVNSNTSGLIASMGAIGVSPGDEVIVPPYTMSATAMAPLFYGGIPVFADIEEATFCIDPVSVKANITSKTRAVIAVNLFGHPAALAELRAICDVHNLFLIEDNAQSPLSHENTYPTGTVGDIGVFSFNYHKHIHTGEGGMCVTNDEKLRRRLALIRNHGENVADYVGETDMTNIVGMNLRMTELQAAIGLSQLANMNKHVSAREDIANQLSAELGGLEGFQVPLVREGCRHNYFCWGARFDAKTLGLSREVFCKALKAEGFPHRVGYLPPLYLLPIFQKRMAFGKDGYPFSLTDRTYERGLCPTAERMEDQELILYLSCHHHPKPEQLERMIKGFHKVYAAIPKLRSLDTQ